MTDFYHSYFIKAIDHSFYGFTGAINHLGSKVGRTLEKFVNHSLTELLMIYKLFSCGLPKFRVACCASKPIERVVYCLNISGSELVLPVSSNNRTLQLLSMPHSRGYKQFCIISFLTLVYRVTQNVANQRAATRFEFSNRLFPDPFLCNQLVSKFTTVS